MSVQEGEKRELVRRYTDAWNEGDLEAVEGIVTEDYVLHDPALFRMPPGPAGVKQAIRVFRNAFPDATFEIDDMLVDGDAVAVRWTVSGTHEGEFFGVEPTGTEFAFEGFELDRLRGDRVAETWTVYDALGLLQQLEVLPELPLEG